MKKPYPRMLYPAQTLDGSKRIVQDAIEEERYTGVKMNADGTVAEDTSVKPPTLEVVMAAGYARERAERIVAQEQAKFEAGYAPYGTNEPPPPPPPVQAVPVAANEPPPSAETITALEATPTMDHAEHAANLLGD